MKYAKNLPVDYTKISSATRAQVRNLYVEIQKGYCCHCGSNLFGTPRSDILELPIDERRFPKGFFRYPIHLHHSHETGMTIGAVHARCNAVLWQYHGE